MASKPDFLAKVPLFHAFDAEDLRHFADAARMQVFRHGEELYAAGAPRSSLYIIIRGNVQVLRSVGGAEVQLARLGAGSFVGEMGVLSDAPRSDTVRALDDVEALVFDGTKLRDLMLARPETGTKLLDAMASRIASSP